MSADHSIVQKRFSSSRARPSIHPVGSSEPRPAYLPTLLSPGPKGSKATMAAAGLTSPSPLKGKPDLVLPMPPPLLHTRSGNEIYEAPSTPTTTGFTSPYATPQGSPSKKQVPPGANELADVFENAVRLTASSPIKNERQQLSPHSPNKVGRPGIEQSLSDTSPCRSAKTANQENTPPNAWHHKDPNYAPTQAALSRQEPYQARETSEKARSNVMRGLTTEELEKVQMPKVKRLANVTQLCKSLSSSL